MVNSVTTPIRCKYRQILLWQICKASRWYLNFVGTIWPNHFNFKVVFLLNIQIFTGIRQSYLNKICRSYNENPYNSVQFRSFIILTSTKYNKNKNMISLISVPSPWGLLVGLYYKIQNLSSGMLGIWRQNAVASHIAHLVLKRRNSHFAQWQLHPLINEGAICISHLYPKTSNERNFLPL